MLPAATQQPNALIDNRLLLPVGGPSLERRSASGYARQQPATADDLPPGLAGHLDRGELVLRSADVGADLAGLLDWAGRHGVDLTGLQVGPPSLEEAYLVLTGGTDLPRKEPSHA